MNKIIFLFGLFLLCLNAGAFNTGLCGLEFYQGSGALINKSFCYLACNGSEDGYNYDSTLNQMIGSDQYENVYGNFTGIVNVNLYSIYEGESYCNLYESPFTVYCEGVVYNISEDYTLDLEASYTFNCSTSPGSTTTTTTTTTTMPDLNQTYNVINSTGETIPNPRGNISGNETNAEVTTYSYMELLGGIFPIIFLGIIAYAFMNSKGRKNDGRR